MAGGGVSLKKHHHFVGSKGSVQIFELHFDNNNSKNLLLQHKLLFKIQIILGFLNTVSQKKGSSSGDQF